MTVSLPDSYASSRRPTYRDALAWLYACRRDGAPRDPARMAGLAGALGLQAPPRLVHVVGTNGKGTVTAMLDEGLRAWGRSSGRFLSPHVEDFRERIAVNGRPVSRETVRRFVARVSRLELEPSPAFFEWTLALALSAFARDRVEWAVVEAGVGGARDATRALEPVQVVVLTNVGLDHLATLGPDLAAIARDKAGAFRPGVPALTGARGEALQVVEAEARRVGAPLTIDRPGDPLFELPPVSPRPSATRSANARLAAAALRLSGAPEEAVRRAVAARPLPGRGERFVVHGREVLLDGAHDPGAALALAASLTPGYVLLFGALERKQAGAMLAALEPGAAEVVLTEAAEGDRPAVDLAGRCFVPEPGRALDVALRRCPPGGLVVAAGSLYLAGRLRPLLRRRAARAGHDADDLSKGARS